MRRNGTTYQIIDTERHVIEPRQLWDKYLDPAARKEVRWVGNGLAIEVAGKLMVQDVAFMQVVEPAPRFEAARKAGFSAAGMLADMDREGVDVAVLYPTTGLYVIWGDHVSGDLSAAICHAYNDWLADFCRQDATRLKGIAMIPLQDVGAAIVEARRAITTLGMVGVLMRPNPLLKRQLNDAAYAPLYAEMERLGKPVCIHSSPGSLLPEIGVNDATGLEWPQGVQRFSGVLPQTAISYPLEIMGAVISLAGEEPMMAFPGLKAHFASAGAGWLFFWAERMDDEWFHRGNDAVTKLKPGHYLERQGLVAARAHERMLPFLMEEFSECVSWGSAWPQPFLRDFPDALDRIVGNAALSNKNKEGILSSNAGRLFALS
jgi:uncharacterized protein